MNIARLAIEKKTITLVLSFILLVGGFVSYAGLSRMEDPEFTIKEALVITPYPGATAEEVVEEVTNQLEIEIQKMSQLYEIESRSEPGLSTINVRMQKKYSREHLPQIWLELRSKVGDAQGRLPPGAGPSLVVDDFGDVMGVFYALSGESFSYAELENVAKALRRELLLVEDVAKVEFYGVQPEVIYIEPNRDRLSQLGISPESFVGELQQKNIVVNAGKVQVGTEIISIEPTGVVDSVEALGDILISQAGSNQQIYLKDVANIKRGYKELPKNLLRFDGKPSIGIAISTVSGGNVVTMGEAVDRRLKELEGIIPLGIELGIVSLQSKATTEAIDGFVINLIAAVAIVIGVLVFFMGLRSSLIIGFVLVLTVSGSFIFMSAWDVALQRISLGALVIALGMLVDNAIVVVDGMLMKIGQGVDRKKAAEDVVKQTAIPLLRATLVAILAFAAIGTSQDSTGEFTRSLYQVILISLMLSWVTGITVTPLLGVMFIKTPEKGATKIDPY
ncbi:MAG: efflux RND transporter permease subunit, partial [Sphingomonadales bacterium]